MGTARRGKLSVLTAVLACGLMLAGCSEKAVEGTAQTHGDVGGLPVTHFESGPKEGAEDADLDVENADHSEMDQLAINAVADLYEFWEAEMPKNFDEQFEPVKRLVSYDAESSPVEICGESTEGLVNAFYCQLDDSVAWDRGTLLPGLNQQFGPMAVVTVLAHEMGHAVQFRLGEKSNISNTTQTIIKEQQADCYAGGFFRWIAEDKSSHFRVSTGEGINQVLGALFMIRDEAGQVYTAPGAHGSAFDRVFAFQEGFTEGVARCADMDAQEMAERITETPFNEQDAGEGNLQIEERYLNLLKQSLDAAFRDTGANPPEFRTDGAECADGTATARVTYCQDENVIAMDVAALNELATPPQRGSSGMEGDGIGDFAAFGEIASRYSMAVQQATGAALDDDNAGLRTACLTGSWAGFASEPHDGEQQQLRLSPGDLDEAIAEMLAPQSLIAADLNGERNAVGFSMVDAFRAGYTDGMQTCEKNYG
ncbi:neutral zinc metallopeptidase [Tamaricihabitans halophyticus]|nr:neutral zinc metallopeptidase [Tamaricihabitans halophyticus]